MKIWKLERIDIWCDQSPRWRVFGDGIFGSGPWCKSRCAAIWVWFKWELDDLFS